MLIFVLFVTAEVLFDGPFSMWVSLKQDISWIQKNYLLKLNFWSLKSGFGRNHQPMFAKILIFKTLIQNTWCPNFLILIKLELEKMLKSDLVKKRNCKKLPISFTQTWSILGGIQLLRSYKMTNICHPPLTPSLPPILLSCLHLLNFGNPIPSCERSKLHQFPSSTTTITKQLNDVNL